MTRILLVEDHDIVRIATSMLLRDMFEHVSIDTPTQFQDALRAVSENTYQLIILDLHIPGGNQLLTIEQLRSLQPGAPILVFSGQKEQLYGVHSIRSGAAGFVSKEANTSELKEAIRVVLDGQRYLSQVVRSQLLGTMLQNGVSNPAELLSAKELVVMNMLLEGKWTKEIAVKLGLKSTTISTFKTRIFKKFGVNNLMDLAKEVEMFLLFRSNDSQHNKF